MVPTGCRTFPPRAPVSHLLSRRMLCLLHGAAVRSKSYHVGKHLITLKGRDDVSPSLPPVRAPQTSPLHLPILLKAMPLAPAFPLREDPASLPFPARGSSEEPRASLAGSADRCPPPPSITFLLGDQPPEPAKSRPVGGGEALLRVPGRGHELSGVSRAPNL